MRKLLFLPAALFLVSCATKPEDVHPSYVSELSYMNYSCAQLGAEQYRLSQALSSASDAQRKARSGDVAGVLLLGLPVSSLSGANQAANIGRLKGELEAVQKAAILKGCNLAPVADPTAKKKR